MDNMGAYNIITLQAIPSKAMVLLPCIVHS